MLQTVKFPFTVRTHATLATMTKLEWLVHGILSFTVRTHTTLATMTKLECLVHRILSFMVRTHAMLATMTKLEWLVHHILSFTVCTGDALNNDIDYRPVWGSLRLAPIICLCVLSIKLIHEAIYVYWVTNLILPYEALHVYSGPALTLQYLNCKQVDVLPSKHQAMCDLIYSVLHNYIN